MILYIDKRKKPHEVAEQHQAIGKYIQKLEEGCEYSVEVKKVKKIRSLSHNAYYWGVVLKVISLWSGEDDDKLHKDYALRFNPDEIHYPNGEVRRVPGETKILDDGEFSNYIGRIKADARMYFPGIVFPEKKEVIDNYSIWERISAEHSRQYDGI